MSLIFKKKYSRAKFANQVIKKLKSFEKEELTTSSLNNAIASVAKDFGISTWAKELITSDNSSDDVTHISGHEWLYDLVCYRYGNEHYALNDTILVMESEWKGKRYASNNNDEEDPYGEVKFDFQKLLLANADIKLMVYKEHRTDKDYNLNEYFIRRIKEYRQGKSSDCFIFACYSQRVMGNRKCFVSTYRKDKGWIELCSK